MFHGSAGRPETEGHGLKFANEEWNESISNGEPFTLQWNETIEGADNAQLGIFKVTYPKDGVREYELVSNLTDFIQSNSCQWTPEGLEDNLYAIWLATMSDGNQSWTISPPWRLKEVRGHGLHWAAPVGIPIVVILGIYALSLITCLFYRRRKRLRREKEEAAATAAAESAERQPSMSSVATTQTFEEPEYKKAEVFFISHEQRRRERRREREREAGVVGAWTGNVVFDGVRFDLGPVTMQGGMRST